MTNKSLFKKHNYLNISAVSVPILVSVLLLVVKFYGYFVTGAVSILSSSLDSLVDILTSMLNMVAVIYASKPPDEDHRFGHNSIEDIVGLMQATFIATSAFFIIYKSILNFINPIEITNNVVGMWIMVVSMFAAFFVVIYQKFIISRTKSVVVEADMLHYLSDVLVNLAIVVSLFLASDMRFSFVDPVLAIFIAVYIFIAAIKIGKRSFNNLMDKELDDEDTNEVRDLISNDKRIKGYHAFRTRRSGNRVFVQLDIELDKDLNVKIAHDIIDDLEKKISDLWIETDVIIHVDPV